MRGPVLRQLLLAVAADAGRLLARPRRRRDGLLERWRHLRLRGGVCLGGAGNGASCGYRQTELGLHAACLATGGSCSYPCLGHGGQTDIKESLTRDEGRFADLDFVVYTPHVWAPPPNAAAFRGINGPAAFPTWFFSSAGPCHPSNAPCPFPCNATCDALEFPLGWTPVDDRDEWELVQAWAWSGSLDGMFVALAGIENSYDAKVQIGEYGHQLAIYPPADSTFEKVDSLCAWFETPSCLQTDLFDHVRNAGGVIVVAHPCRVGGIPAEWDGLPNDPVIVGMELSTEGEAQNKDCVDDSAGEVGGRDYHSVLDPAGLNRKVGAFGSSDIHGPPPGGKRQTFVWADQLTRDAIFDAIQNRHTYAYLGLPPQAGLADKGRPRFEFSINQAIMGSEITVSAPFGIAVRMRLTNTAEAEAAGQVFSRVELVHNGAVIRQSSCTAGANPACSLILSFTTVQSGYYYARVVDDSGFPADKVILVTSPIWVTVN